MTWFLEAAKTRYHSQAGEDGVLEELDWRLDIRLGFFVDVGAGDGTTLSNTRALAERCWSGLWIEADTEKAKAAQRAAADVLAIKAQRGLSPTCGAVLVAHSTATAENINELITHHPDLLSLDIDGNDYWVWKALARRPRIVCIEYNAGFPPETRKTIAYDPAFQFSGTDYHGATAGALVALGREKGYKLVAYCGVNLFFVANELAEGFDEVPLSEVPWRRSWRKDPEREMVEV